MAAKSCASSQSWAISGVELSLNFGDGLAGQAAAVLGQMHDQDGKPIQGQRDQISATEDARQVAWRLRCVEQGDGRERLQPAAELSEDWACLANWSLCTTFV